MGDENTDAQKGDEGAKDQANADANKDAGAEDQSKGDDSGKKADKSDDAGADNADSKKDDKSGDDAKGDDGKGDEGDADKSKADNDEPPVKPKTKLDFIKERQQKRAEKQAQKGDGEDTDDEDDEDEDDESASTDKVKKEVEKQLKPLKDVIHKQEEEKFLLELKTEVSTFLGKEGNDVFKPYEAKILKFASHESRKHLPLQTIAYEVAGPDLMKLGAQKGKEMDAKADKTKAGGGSGDSGSDKKDVWSVPKAEFEKQISDAKRLPRKGE